MKKPMLFEHTIRLFLGDKAKDIDHVANDPKEWKKWIKNAVKEMMKNGLVA